MQIRESQDNSNFNNLSGLGPRPILTLHAHLSYVTKEFRRSFLYSLLKLKDVHKGCELRGWRHSLQSSALVFVGLMGFTLESFCWNMQSVEPLAGKREGIGGPLSHFPVLTVSPSLPPSASTHLTLPPLTHHTQWHRHPLTTYHRYITVPTLNQCLFDFSQRRRPWANVKIKLFYCVWFTGMCLTA